MNAHNSPITFKELKTRPCTLEDFDVEEGEDKSSYGFYPLHEKTNSAIVSSTIMKCIDEPFEIKGEFNTNTAANLMIVFDKCDPTKRTCKSEAEIIEFLEFKYIIYMDNEIHYKHQNDHSLGEHIEKYSNFQFLSVSSTVRTDNLKLITISDVEYSEDRVGLGFDMITHRVFTNLDGITRFLPYKNNFQTALTYEVGTTRYQLIR